jgi:hypothetical protein
MFGAGLSDVRIHESAVQGRELACTWGADIWFARGAYRPHDPEGLEVLGHELAHVLQQRAGRAGGGVAGLALEAEACRAGDSVARGEPVRLPPPRKGHAVRSRAVTQFYTIVPFAHWGDDLARPITAPAGVHHVPGEQGGTFPGQTKIGASFLSAPGVVNLVSTPVAAGVSLRISHSGTMAIEHCDLNTRQPKAFYATDEVIRKSNERLELIGALYRLAPDPNAGQRISNGDRILRRVLPRHVTNGSVGFAVMGSQNCDLMVQYVAGNVGSGALSLSR